MQFFSGGMTQGSGVGGGGEPVGTPQTILGGSLIQWIEIGAGSENLSGGFSTSLSDLSPNGYHLTAASTQQALYEAGGWNGSPSINFDGGNDFYTDAGAFATDLIGGSDTGFTLRAALQYHTTGVDSVAISCGNSAGTTPLFDVFSSAGSKFVVSKNSGGAKTISSPGASDKLRHVHKLRCSGTQLQMSIDGAVVVDFAAANFDTSSATFNRSAFGALVRNTISLFFNGRMAAVVSSRGLETAPQEAAMDAYFAKFLAAGTAPMLLINGDSLSTADKWPVDFAAAYPNATVVNTSAPGQTLFGYGLPNRQRDTHSNYDGGRPHNLVSFTFGSNDIVNARTGAQIYANLQTVVSGEIAANPARPIVVPTIGWRTGLSSSEENERQAFNTLVRADKAGATYLLDRDIIIPPSDAALLPDGTHPGTLGNTYMFEGRNGAPGYRDFLVAQGFGT